MTVKKYLAFDYGASSGRSILGLFDGEKLTLEETHRFGSDPVMINGTFTWDFLRLFFEMKQGLRKSFALHGDIDSVGVDTWGVDFGLLGKNGELLGNPVHYRDTRTDGMIEEACRILSAKEIFDTTGIAFQKFNTLYQLLALSKAGSPLLKMADTMLFMPDLFNYFLTGEKCCEFTITSTSQMYDPKAGNWAYGLLEKLGIRSDILPKVIPAGTKLSNIKADVCDELGIPAVPVIAVAEHDTGSAALSVPYEQKNSAFLSSGTWSLLGIELEKPIINEKTRELNYTNEGCINNGFRLLKNIMGLWIQNECIRNWEARGEKISFKELDQSVIDAKPFIAVVDVDDPSFFEPYKMPEKIQEYCRKTGQTVPETHGEIMRVVMEGLALKYRQAIEGLEKIVGFTVPSLNIVGGGTKNRVLSGFTANAINRPVIAGPIEATAIGNIAAQMIAMGDVRNVDEVREVIRNSFPLERYEPSDTEVWDAAYEKLLRLQKQG